MPQDRTFNSVHGVIPAMEPTISRTSRRTSSGALPINAGLRACQSKLLICEQRITPRAGNPGGNGTSDAYPLTLLVIGQTNAKEVFRLNRCEESTKAGLRPACSRPACGSKSNQTRSPESGQNGSTKTQPRVEDPNQSLAYWLPLECRRESLPASCAYVQLRERHSIA